MWSSEYGSQELEHGDALGILSSNLTTLFQDAKKKEHKLWKELHEHSLEQNEHALAAVLISRKIHCRLRGKPLQVMASRISEVVLYNDVNRTFLASMIATVCGNKNRQFTQHCWYYTHD